MSPTKSVGKQVRDAFTEGTKAFVDSLTGPGDDIYVRQEERNRERNESNDATWGEQRRIEEHEKAENDVEEQHQKQPKYRSM